MEMVPPPSLEYDPMRSQCPNTSNCDEDEGASKIVPKILEIDSNCNVIIINTVAASDCNKTKREVHSKDSRTPASVDSRVVTPLDMFQSAPADSGGAGGGGSTGDDKDEQQDTENISDYTDVQLKALLEEAMTYKTPRDRENKSEVFKELLKAAENEANQADSPFSDCRAGGSLQNICQSVNNEKWKHCGLNGRNSRHYSHLSGNSQYLSNMGHHSRHGGRGARSEMGPSIPIYQAHHSHHNSQHHHQSTRSYVSSRQCEGGSLPSNVDQSSYEHQQPFLREVKRRSQIAAKANSESSASNTNNEDPLGEKANLKVGGNKSSEAITSLTDDGSKYTANNISNSRESSQFGGKDSAVSFIESLPGSKMESVRSSEDIELATSHQTPKGHIQYRTNMNINIEELQRGTTCSTSNSTFVISPLSGSLQSKNLGLSGDVNGGKKLSPLPISAEMNYGVDVGISLPLMKNISDRKEMYVLAQAQGGTIQSALVANMVEKEEVDSKPSNPRQKSNKNRSKDDRNTRTILSDDIVGARGEETLDRLVQFIESDNCERQHGNNLGGGGKKNRNKTSKKDVGNGGGSNGGKLKKSNSMNELRSCSKLEEINSDNVSNHENGIVILRSKTKNQRAQNTNAGSGEVSSKSSSSGGQGHHSKGDRGERRSWGTEELSYLGDSQAHAANQNANSKNSKSEGSTGMVYNYNNKNGSKTLAEMAVNSISMDSIISSGWANEEFHVVTKKRKSKKKQNIVVQAFDMDSTRMANNKRQLHNNNNNNYYNNNNQLDQHYASSRPKYTNCIKAPAATIRSTHGSSNYAGNRMGRGAGTDMRSTSGAINAAKSRRKSTSSVPPSEKSDCSDLDSVHSLPIESPSRNTVATINKQPKRSSKADAMSYADIAKKSNSRIESNAGEAIQVNNHWPLLVKDGGEQVQPVSSHANTNSNTNNNNNNTFVAVSKSMEKEENKTRLGSRKMQPTLVTTDDGAGGGDGEPVHTKNILQKSKSVDYESSMAFNMNIDQYPSLETAVNKKVLNQSVGVSPNNPTIKVAATSPSTAAKKMKTTSQIVGEPPGCSVSAPDHADTNNNLNNNNNAKANINDYINGNNISNVNLSGALGVVGGASNAEDELAVKVGAPTSLCKSNQQSSSVASEASDNKLSYMSHNSTSHTVAADRPAVIILNDDLRHTNLQESDITFGFDVNNLLLLGENVQEGGSAVTGIVHEMHPISADRNGPFQNTQATHDQLPSIADDLNVANSSDYHSYGSCVSPSSSSMKHVQADDSILIHDNNNNDTHNEWSIGQQQSTPKVAVTNCRNCSVRNNGVIRIMEDGLVVTQPNTTLMKNSCVQTSLDNLSLKDIHNEEVRSAENGSLTDTATATESTANDQMDVTLQPTSDCSQLLSNENNMQRSVAKESYPDACGDDVNQDKVCSQKQSVVTNAVGKVGLEPSEGKYLLQKDHEKIINFVGLAWENLTHNKTSKVKYYNGL